MAWAKVDGIGSPGSRDVRAAAIAETAIIVDMAFTTREG